MLSDANSSFYTLLGRVAKLVQIAGSHESHVYFFLPSKVNVCFYIAQYPVRWIGQSALYFLPPPPPRQTCSFRHQLDFSGKHSSHAAITHNDYSLKLPPLSIARYSFIQLSELERHGKNEKVQTSKRCQRGFEHKTSRLRVRHSTSELLFSNDFKYRPGMLIVACIRDATSSSMGSSPCLTSLPNNST